MGYGISLVQNNIIKFCTSSKSYSFSTELADVAEFAQEKTAQATIRDMMRSGKFTRDCKFCTFEVVKLAGAMTEVKWVKEKTGIVLEFNGNYYSAGKKVTKNSWPTAFNNINRATIFDSQEQAQVMYDFVISTMKKFVEDEEKDNEYYQRSSDYYKKKYESMLINLKITQV